MLESADMPDLPTLASFVASVRNRFPPPPDWLIDDPVVVSSSRHIEDFVSFVRTGITLAARSAADGNTVLSTDGSALSCDDIVEALVYWTRVAIHGLENSEFDDAGSVGDVDDLIDELNAVVGVLVSTAGRARDRGVVESDRDVKWEVLDTLRRRLEM